MWPGSTISIEDINKRYNEQWFSDHQLIVVETMENSGSYRLKVLGINRIGNNVVINIERFEPEAFSDDCKAWQILIETDRCIDNNAEFEVVISNRRVYPVISHDSSSNPQSTNYPKQLISLKQQLKEFWTHR